MTTRTFERLLNKSPELASAAGASEKLVRKILEMAEKDVISRRRQPAPPAPEGGISIRAAGKKYKIPFQTISQWVQTGALKSLKRTKNALYIKESDIAGIATKYKQHHGRGKKAIFNELKSKQTTVSS